MSINTKQIVSVFKSIFLFDLFYNRCVRDQQTENNDGKNTGEKYCRQPTKATANNAKIFHFIALSTSFKRLIKITNMRGTYRMSSKGKEKKMFASRSKDK